MARGNRYNPNTGKRDDDGPRARHLSIEDLSGLVEAHEEPLRAAWSRRSDDESILILGDLRRPEVLQMAEQQWGKDNPARVLDQWGKIGIGDKWPPLMAFLQHRGWIDLFGRSGDFAHRECAKELRAFAELAGLGFVPLLVVTKDGLWTTQWARPDSRAIVVRYEPETPAEAN